MGQKGGGRSVLIVLMLQSPKPGAFALEQADSVDWETVHHWSFLFGINAHFPNFGLFSASMNEKESEVAKIILILLA